MTREPLKGWKEIAEFLHSSERTVQRWERELGMPVARIATAQRRSVVFGDPEELSAWAQRTAAQRSAEAELASMAPADDQPTEEDEEEDVREEGPEDQATAPESTSGEEITGPEAGLAALVPPTKNVTKRWIAVGVGALVVVGVTAAALRFSQPQEPLKPAATQAKPANSQPANNQSTSTQPAAVPASQTPLPSKPQPGDIIRFRFWSLDGSPGMVGLRPGMTATYSFGSHPPIALSVEIEDSGVALQIYKTSADRLSPNRLTEVAIVRLKPGERAKINAGIDISEVEWVGTVHPTPKPNGASSPAGRSGPPR